MTDWRGRTVIYEPVGRGHRLTYVRYLLEGLGERGIRPIVALGPRAKAHESYEVQLGPFRGSFDEHALLDIEGTGVRVFAARARELAQLIKRHKPERLWYPNADGVAQVASIMGRSRLIGFGNCRVTPLVLRGSAAYREPPRTIGHRVADRVYAGMLRSRLFDRVLLIDRLVEAWCASNGFADRVRLIPDPLPPAPSVRPAEARRRLGLDPSGRGFSIVGALDARKGVDRLVRAFKLLHERGALREDDRLYMAGRWDDIVRGLIEGEAAPLVERGLIRLNPDYVSEEDLWLWLAAGDVVVAPYPRHVGPASIAVRAAALGRPVVGGSFGWLGRLIEDYGIGTAASVDPEGLADAMMVMLGRAEGWEPTERSMAYVAGLTVDGFVRGFLDEPA
ncbi:MAG: glycosyltransferase [Planctomycetota bacterium]